MASTWQVHAKYLRSSSVPVRRMPSSELMGWDKGSVLHMRWDKGSVLHMRTMAELMAEHVSDRELDVWDYDGWGHAS